MDMRNVVASAYNASQLILGGNKCRFGFCSSVKDNDAAMMDRASEELRGFISEFSDKKDIHFNGNIVSVRDFGMVYIFSGNLPICPTFYPKCAFGTADAENENEDGQETPFFTEAMVSDSPIGEFVNGKKYGIIRWISKIGQTYARMKDENGTEVCIRKDHLVIDS